MPAFRLRSSVLLMALGLVAAGCGGGEAASTTSPASVTARVDEGSALLDDGAYEEALAIFDALILDLEDQGESLVLNRARIDRGAALAGLETLDESAAAFDSFIEQIGLTGDPANGSLVLEAVLNRLNLGVGAEEWLEQYPVYQELLDHYQGSEDPAVIANYVRIVNSHALVLEAENLPDEALGLYDSIAEQYGEITAPEVVVPVASTYALAANNLRVRSRDEEALLFYQQAIDIAASSGLDGLTLLESEARLDMAQLLTKLGAPVEALAAYDAQLIRFGGRSELAHRRLAVRGILESGLLLQDLDRIDEAQAAYLEILRTVEVPSSDPTLASLAGLAQHQLGIIDRR